MAKLKKGEKLVCIPCGREVVISNSGISRTTILCCGRAMAHKKRALSKKRTCKR